MSVAGRSGRYSLQPPSSWWPAPAASASLPRLLSSLAVVSLLKGGGEALQEASHLDCIVFDKTGTITEGGEPVVTDHQTPYGDGGETDDIWGALLELEQNSSHPIAREWSSLQHR